MGIEALHNLLEIPLLVWVRIRAVRVDRFLPLRLLLLTILACRNCRYSCRQDQEVTICGTPTVELAENIGVDLIGVGRDIGGHLLGVGERRRRSLRGCYAAFEDQEHQGSRNTHGRHLCSLTLSAPGVADKPGGRIPIATGVTTHTLSHR